MTTKLSQLMAELSPKDLAEVRKRSAGHLEDMAVASRLDEIRRAANMTQGDIARAMGVGQNAVSQLESRDDVQLSTLSRYVESAGYRLEFTLVDANGERVVLENFRPWERVKTTAKKSSAQKRAAPPASTPTRSKSQPAREIAAAANRSGQRTRQPRADRIAAP